MLANGQAQDVGRSGKAKAIDGDIVRGLCDFGEREVLECVWLEDFSRSCGGNILSVDVSGHFVWAYTYLRPQKSYSLPPVQQMQQRKEPIPA